MNCLFVFFFSYFHLFCVCGDGQSYSVQMWHVMQWSATFIMMMTIPTLKEKSKRNRIDPYNILHWMRDCEITCVHKPCLLCRDIHYLSKFHSQKLHFHLFSHIRSPLCFFFHNIYLCFWADSMNHNIHMWDVGQWLFLFVMVWLQFLSQNMVWDHKSTNSDSEFYLTANSTSKQWRNQVKKSFKKEMKIKEIWFNKSVTIFHLVIWTFQCSFCSIWKVTVQQTIHVCLKFHENVILAPSQVNTTRTVVSWFWMLQFCTCWLWTIVF